MGKQIVGEKKEIKKVGEKKKRWGQILNMFQKSENLKFSNMVTLKYGCVQNMIAFKYGCVQIWLRSNMAAPNVEHRTLEEWHSTLFSSCRRTRTNGRQESS